SPEALQVSVALGRAAGLERSRSPNCLCRHPLYPAVRRQNLPSCRTSFRSAPWMHLFSAISFLGRILLSLNSFVRTPDRPLLLASPLRNQMVTYYSSIAEFRPHPSLCRLRSSLISLRFYSRRTSHAGVGEKPSDHSILRWAWRQNLPGHVRAFSPGKDS